jgi:hypothetical protein
MFVSKNTRSVGLWFILFMSLMACVASLAAQAPAQGNAADRQQRIAALRESLAQNQAALKTYTWKEATEISLNGEVKKQEQKQCRYGADGKVQKTVIGGGDKPEQKQQEQAGGRRGGGRLKQAVVENKVEDMKEYMEKAAALVHQYVPQDGQKIQAALAAGKVSTQPASAQGLTTITISDYVKAGDKLILGFDPTAKKLRSYQVQSYVEKPKDDAVALAVTFASLPDGTNYPQQTALDVAAKKIKVKITNSGYAKATP